MIREEVHLLPEMVENLLYQMRVKLRAEAAGLSGVNWEGGQIVLRFAASDEEKESRRMPDLGPGIRGGKGAYWCNFGKEANWQNRLLEVLSLVPTSH